MTDLVGTICGSRARWGAGRQKEGKVWFLSSGMLAISLEISLDWQVLRICKESQDLTTSLLTESGQVLGFGGRTWPFEDGPLVTVPRSSGVSSLLPNHLDMRRTGHLHVPFSSSLPPSLLLSLIFLFLPLPGSGKEPLFLSEWPLEALQQRSPTLLAPGISSMEASFCQSSGVQGDGAGTIIMLRGVVGHSSRRFAHWPTAHLLLCAPVPNRPQTGTSLQPRGWGPLLHRTPVPRGSGEIPPLSASGRRQNLGLVRVWCLVAWTWALCSLQHTLSCRPCCALPLSMPTCSHSAQYKAEPVSSLSSPIWDSLVAQLAKNPPAM